MDTQNNCVPSKIAEEILGPIEWVSTTNGYCECPGKRLHTQNNSRSDCMIFLDRVPTVFCLHNSCKKTVDAKNRELRLAIRNSSVNPEDKRRFTAEEKALLKESRRKRFIQLRARSARSKLLIDHRWTYEQMFRESPVVLQNNERDHWRLLLEKFEDGDVIWIGNKLDSGHDHNFVNFLTKEEWLACTNVTQQFICPATFQPGSISRTNDNIVCRRFLVVESDELTKDQVGAIFQWLKGSVGLSLEAIVDTAGKSLHGWFRFPDDETLAELKLILPELGCDSKLFTPSQPVRLPGAIRNGKYQKLIYLSKGGCQ